MSLARGVKANVAKFHDHLLEPNQLIAITSTPIQSAEFPWNELGDRASVCGVVGGGVRALKDYNLGFQAARST